MRVRSRGPGTVPEVVSSDAPRWLTDDADPDPSALGAKAANLVVAGRAGLSVVAGFVVPVEAVGLHPIAPPSAARAAWAALSCDGALPLVVRSSAPGEDLASSSMAGVFDSVIDVSGWDDFVAAYDRVVRSAHGAPMAVLVQRFVRPRLGGVLFGVDPVSGRDDRTVIVAVDGGPHALVSGAVEGRRTVLDRTGRVHGADGDPGPVLSRRERQRLLALARRAHRTFGQPQDIEWAIDDDQALLLQSRPITTTTAIGVGPVLGPGPVAETFPHPLRPLEQDLWVVPLARAVDHVLRLTGAASTRRLRRDPAIRVVEDQVTADLDLLGAAVPRRWARRALDPRPHVRRLVVAWRVGRIRGALPALAATLLDEVDDALRAVPAFESLHDEDLVRILDNAGAYLCSLHGHEMLAGGMLGDEGATGAELALAAVAEGRSRGWSDEDIVARTPVSLALTAPSLGTRAPLPEVTAPVGGRPAILSTREALRLRVRWIHELTRAVVHELGHRIGERGLLVDVELPNLSWAELRAAVDGVPVVGAPPAVPRSPLPAAFRLSSDGAVVPEVTPGSSGGVGAGGERASGRVAFHDPAIGDVLVVRTLDPALAPLLGHVAGIVAETGSPLSHLAILAREQGVPVVVGHRSIREVVAEGDVVVVDGRTGDVEVLEHATGSWLR